MRLKRTNGQDEVEEKNGHHEGSLRRLAPRDYTVGWISALSIELATARAVLDEIHDDIDCNTEDLNSYTFGSIGGHNIVIACLPSYGNNNAAVVASHMWRSFPNIKIRLMVGIGGGAPEEVDIRLGDIVVSTEVMQYDFGKTVAGGQFFRTSTPIRPPQAIMTAVSKLRAIHESQPSEIPIILDRMLERYPRMRDYAYPSSAKDRLFRSTYEHDASARTCEDCDQAELKSRHLRPDANPEIHYGLIASGNQVMRHGATRDYWTKKDKVLCFEMEAAGLMSHFPCLVIRGICDYADSHKSKEWQKHAAATAAAYARELLIVVRPLRPWDRGTEEDNKSSSHLTEEYRQALLSSLRFQQLDARRMSIRAPHLKTCEWVLSSPTYAAWAAGEDWQQSTRLLWIKGKPGAGKSTMMKFLFGRAVNTSRKNRTILSFFFNARGAELERSVIGMYRSLLVQMLDAFADLLSVFDGLQHTGLGIHHPPEFSLEMLKDFLERAFHNIRGSSIICFIDALDECDQRQVRDMVSFFERLCNSTTSQGVDLRICFSSRHYPHIEVRGAFQIVLEQHGGHKQDILTYIHGKLHIGQSGVAETIREKLYLKSSGVFMWVVLVVDILNVEYDDGHIHALEDLLNDIHGDLHSLFEDILTRDKRHRKEVLLCLQCILFATTPLHPDELYLAIRVGVANQKPDWEDIFTTSVDDVKKFILSSSKGLADITGEHKTVQFIHESVRDFLLKERGITSIESNMHNLEGQGHESLKLCCEGFLKPGVEDYLSSCHGVSFRDMLGSAHNPLLQFLKYAVENVLHHANEASGYGVSQRDFIKSFDVARWSKLHSLISDRYRQTGGLLDVLASGNYHHLIPLYPSIMSCIEERVDASHCPYTLAMVLRHSESVSAFRNAMAKNLPSSNPAKELFNKVLDLEHTLDYGSRRSLVSYVAEHGDDAVLTLLIVRGEALDVKDSYRGTTPLAWASMNGHEGVVRLLLDTEKVDVNSIDTVYRTPLSYAVESNHYPVVQALLETHKVDVSQTDSDGNTLLSFAATEGFEEIVRLLLKTREIDMTQRDGKGRTALAHAIINGHVGIVHAFIEVKHLDLNTTDNEGRSLLSLAAMHKHDEIVQLLLQESLVDINLKDQYGQTPLSLASAMGSPKAVRVLLSNSQVEVNSRDHNGRTPLSWAAGHGDTEIVLLLINIGRADVEVRDDVGRDPRVWATHKGHHETCEAISRHRRNLPQV